LKIASKKTSRHTRLIFAEEKMPDIVSMLDAETSCRIDQYQCESSADELWKQYHDGKFLKNIQIQVQVL
jgi:hypothetical protein